MEIYDDVNPNGHILSYSFEKKIVQEVVRWVRFQYVEPCICKLVQLFTCQSSSHQK